MKFDPYIVQARVPSPLGVIAIAATPQGLAGLWFTDNQRYLPPKLSGPAAWPDDAAHPVLKQARQQLGEYFAGQRSMFDVPLDLRCGTAFQQSVWQALLKIPPGHTTSYGALSSRIGKPAATRAVWIARRRCSSWRAPPCASRRPGRRVWFDGRHSFVRSRDW